MPTATSTLDSLGTIIINTGVAFLETIFGTYWPYYLLAIALTGLVAVVYKLMHVGSGGARR